MLEPNDVKFEVATKLMLVSAPEWHTTGELGIIETLPLPHDQKVIMMASVAIPSIAFRMEQVTPTKKNLSKMAAVTPTLTLFVKATEIIRSKPVGTSHWWS